MTFKPKTCKACKKKFTPLRALQSVCSMPCSIVYARMLKAKSNALERTKERQAIREARERIKTRQQWLKEVQIVFNRYIRLRDKDLPCISCQRFHSGQYHAGHYRSIGSCPELRFEENNVHKQCSACNNHLSGNIINFRINLKNKVGDGLLEWLEGKHEPLKLTIEELKALKAEYKSKCRELETKG
jgi:hypothetical protein